MKIGIYACLLTLFIVVIFQVNSMFNKDEQVISNWGTSVNKEKLSKEKYLKEIQKLGKKMTTKENEIEQDVVKDLDNRLNEAEYNDMVKFSKRYFSTVGRNFRVFYMKDDKLVYLYRMWFDQNRKPSTVIKQSFPLIFTHPGCCFAGEPDFFVVVPGTPLFKETGHYKFNR